MEGNNLFSDNNPISSFPKLKGYLKLLLPKIVSFFLLLIIFFNGSEGYCLQQEDYDTEDVHISIHSKTPSPRSLSSETGFSLYPLSSSRTSSVSDITLAAPSPSIAKLPYDCWKLVLSFLKVTQTPNLVLVLSRIYDNIGLTTDRIGVITNSTLNNDFETFNQKELLYLNTDDTNSSNDFLDFMLSSSQPIVQSFSLPCCIERLLSEIFRH